MKGEENAQGTVVYCCVCGNKSLDHWHYCRACGSTLVPQQATNVASVSAGEHTRERLTKGILILTGGGLLLLLVLVFSAVVSIRQASSNQTSTSTTGQSSPTSVPPFIPDWGAFDQPMRFSSHKPCGGTEDKCNKYILAEGEITPNTPTDFETFMANVNDQPMVYFDSPGGSLDAALALGRMLRQRSLTTYIGGPYRYLTRLRPEKINVLIDHGRCFSSCAYAFMGGRTRELTDQGTIGVHQFYGANGDSGESHTQEEIASLGIYLDEMGIDRRILDIASQTAPSSMQEISVSTARQLNLITQPGEPAEPTESTEPANPGTNSAGETAITEGYDTLTGFDSYTGNLETLSGKTYVVYREGEHSTALGWQWNSEVDKQQPKLYIGCTNWGECLIKNTTTNQVIHAKLSEEKTEAR